MGGIIMEAAEESVPIVEAVGDVEDSAGYLAIEIGELGGEAMDHQHTEERFRDRLANVARFCGKATDARAVLYNGFCRGHACLEEPVKYPAMYVEWWVFTRSWSMEMSWWEKELGPPFRYGSSMLPSRQLMSRK
jgi:hypothetical protein